VRDEKFLFDPAPHRTRRHFDEVGDLLDRVELGGRLRSIGFHSLRPNSCECRRPRCGHRHLNNRL
jgi:hypothetical protein